MAVHAERNHQIQEKLIQSSTTSLHKSYAKSKQVKIIFKKLATKISFENTYQKIRKKRGLPTQGKNNIYMRMPNSNPSKNNHKTTKEVHKFYILLREN